MTAGAALGAAVLGITLLAAAATLFVYARTGVAPIPAPAWARPGMVELLRQTGVAGGTIYELGCGYGGLALDLARAFPEAHVVGYELSPIPWAVARLRARRQPNLEVRFGDFFDAPLAGASAVLTYLMLKPMMRLARKLDAELAPGTPVLALAFHFRGRTPDATRSVPGLYPCDIALYRWMAESPNPPRPPG